MLSISTGLPGDLLRVRLIEKIQDLFLEALTYRLGVFTQACLFIGGTSIARSFGSLRHSDDLNFLITEDSSVQIRKMRNEISRDVATGLTPFLPEDSGAAALTISSPTEDRLYTDQPPASLQNGKAQVGPKRFDWVIELKYLGIDDTIRIKPDFRVIDATHDVFQRGAFLKGHGFKIWTADAGLLRDVKIAAILGRAQLKWRDVFDLGLLHKLNPMSAPIPEHVLDLPTLSKLCREEIRARANSRIALLKSPDAPQSFEAEMREVLLDMPGRRLRSDCASYLEVVRADLESLFSNKAV
jgi:hypothetical protein